MGLSILKPAADLIYKELYGKKVLLRVDFNVPISNGLSAMPAHAGQAGKISEHYRIKSNKETIDFLTSNGAKVCIASHIAAIDSFETIANQIKEILGVDFNFINDCIGESVETALNNAKSSDVFLLDNLRKYDGEEKNNLEFAEKLAKPFDLYINNAFSVCHRKHASLVAVTEFLPSYAGFLLVKEIDNLNETLKAPMENKILIVGGNKMDTKLSVIKNFIGKAENILIGGAITEKMLEKNLYIIFPKDYISENGAISDIGPETVKEFTRIIDNSKIVVWSGTLGKAEEERFSDGSKKIAEAIINSNAFSIVGGGDTIAFLEKVSLIDMFDYISTGGGAMLEFLAGNKLPGLVALGYE